MTSSKTSIPRVAIYARQSVEEDQGIRQQLDDGRKHAADHGWTVVHEFSDNDTSGSKERGPKTDWARMLSAFDEDEFDTLIVTETSRLTRSLTDVLDVTPPRRAMRVIVIRQGIDTLVADFQLKLLVLVAENEVKLKAQRAARYAADRRKVGHPTSGKTPHGYRWVPAGQRDERGTRYVVDEAEAEDVRQIFREFLAGATLGQIARDLTSTGRLTRKGARWHSSTVRRVLMNPLYAALLPPAQPTGQHSMAAIDLEACTPGAWQPIVTRDDIVAARSRLVGVKPMHAGTARRWLLAGIALCGVCRKPVKSSRPVNHPTPRKDGSVAPAQRYHGYRCHFSRNGDVIDEFVSELCIQRLSQPDAVDLLTPPDDEFDLPALHTRRDALQAERKNVFALIGSDPSRLAAAQDRLEELEEQLREVDAVIAKAAERHPLADLMGVEDVRAWWESRTLARQRAIVQLLMTVVIKPVGMGHRPRRPQDVLASLEITPLI
ncbi:recombinase family protein [Leucobacter massiliensis]|uniref:recombinase family protein n=1 Tax=Leucobacter massiliensis TaxID=1686285 RepID=UPI0015E430D9|nr:recombinase family protein [Leucobacter massiliensis]